jgi:hypothetical protein
MLFNIADPFFIKLASNNNNIIADGPKRLELRLHADIARIENLVDIACWRWPGNLLEISWVL